MNNLVSTYNAALQAIYDHVGLKEDWTTYPILDCTDHVWRIDGGELVYAESVEELNSGGGNCYSGPIHTDRFYPKHIYVGDTMTLVFYNSQVDGMKYFAIMDNTKRK